MSGEVRIGEQKTPFCPLEGSDDNENCVEVKYKNTICNELPICKRVHSTLLVMRGKVAWGLPKPIMMELSVLFPKVLFEIEYGEETNGNVSAIRFKDGYEVKDDSYMTIMYGELDNWMDSVMDKCR